MFDFLEPITQDNIHELIPGEWIWDKALCERAEHKRTIFAKKILEPIGFRQIHILDIDRCSPLPYSKPWMLSTIDGYHGPYAWEIYEYGRFYKFKKEATDDAD